MQGIFCALSSLTNPWRRKKGINNLLLRKRFICGWCCYAEWQRGYIEAARASYDALTDEQKALVTPEDLAKLTAAEDALAALEATGVENIQGNVKNVKTMVNGQIYILRGDKTYTTDGRLVRW